MCRGFNYAFMGKFVVCGRCCEWFALLLYMNESMAKPVLHICHGKGCMFLSRGLGV